MAKVLTLTQIYGIFVPPDFYLGVELFDIKTQLGGTKKTEKQKNSSETSVLPPFTASVFGHVNSF